MLHKISVTWLKTLGCAKKYSYEASFSNKAKSCDFSIFLMSRKDTLFNMYINSEINKSPSNGGLIAEFYNQFSNELTPVFLDVYDSWGKLGTMGVTSRTETSMIFYIEEVIKKILQNYRLISS